MLSWPLGGGGGGERPAAQPLLAPPGPSMLLTPPLLAPQGSCTGRGGLADVAPHAVGGGVLPRGMAWAEAARCRWGGQGWPGNVSLALSAVGRCRRGRLGARQVGPPIRTLRRRGNVALPLQATAIARRSPSFAPARGVRGLPPLCQTARPPHHRREGLHAPRQLLVQHGRDASDEALPRGNAAAGSSLERASVPGKRLVPNGASADGSSRRVTPPPRPPTLPPPLPASPSPPLGPAPGVAAPPPPVPAHQQDVLYVAKLAGRRKREVQRSQRLAAAGDQGDHHDGRHHV